MVTPLVGPNLTHWDAMGWGRRTNRGVEGWCCRFSAAGPVPTKRRAEQADRRSELKGGKTGEKPFPIPVKKSYDKKLASPRYLSVLKLSAAKFSTAWFMSTLCSDRTLI